MAKVLVLYYSSFGHIEQMAYAVAEGARRAGATADVKRVPENVPAEVANAFHFKLDQPAPVATVDELANYDAIIVGAPTRCRVASRNFVTDCLTKNVTRGPEVQDLERRRTLAR